MLVRFWCLFPNFDVIMDFVDECGCRLLLILKYLWNPFCAKNPDYIEGDSVPECHYHQYHRVLLQFWILSLHHTYYAWENWILGLLLLHMMILLHSGGEYGPTFVLIIVRASVDQLQVIIVSQLFRKCFNI